MTRFALLSAALLSVAGTAHAAGYEATPAAPLATHIVIRDTAWTCAGATCTAPRSGTSPDAVMCAAAAKKLGALTAFSANDRAFDVARLDKCNGAARIAAR